MKNVKSCKKFIKNIINRFVELSNRKKIIFIFFMIFMFAVIIILINLEYLMLPKNSITVDVRDENGKAIRGLIVYVNSGKNSFPIEYEDTTSVTKLEVLPGEYTLSFISVPKGYSCPEGVQSFVLEEDEKIFLKYICIE